MNKNKEIWDAINNGWYAYQQTMIAALSPLDAEQLELRSAPHLRSIAEIAAHVIGARARWFYQLMGIGGDTFKSFCKWDRRGARPRKASEVVDGISATWTVIQNAINSWTPEEWKTTWPGESDDEPRMITRQWVIWHLIEHDLHHGGEISITLGSHKIPALDL